MRRARAISEPNNDVISTIHVSFKAYMISGVTFIAALFERSMQGAGFVSSSASSTDRGSRSPETMARGVSVVFRELTERASSFLRFSTLITMSVSGNQNFPISFAAIERSFCRRARIDSRRTRATRANRRHRRISTGRGKPDAHFVRQDANRGRRRG